PPQDQEVEEPDAYGSDDDRRDRIAVPEDREECPESRLDQDPVGDIADGTADPVTKRRQEAGIVPEPGLRVGVDARVPVGFPFRERLEYPRERVHPPRCDDPRDDRAEGPCRDAEGTRE